MKSSEVNLTADRSFSFEYAADDSCAPSDDENDMRRANDGGELTKSIARATSWLVSLSLSLATRGERRFGEPPLKSLGKICGVDETLLAELDR